MANAPAPPSRAPPWGVDLGPSEVVNGSKYMCTPNPRHQPPAQRFLTNAREAQRHAGGPRVQFHAAIVDARGAPRAAGERTPNSLRDKPLRPFVRGSR